MKRVLTLLASLLLVACAVGPGMMPPPPPPTTGGASATATIGFGAEAMLDGLVIRPLAVVEDSRCPVNARCVWAGRLILRTDLAAGRLRERRDLVLGAPQQVPVGTLTLVGAEPAKIAGGQTSRPADRFTFQLTR